MAVKRRGRKWYIRFHMGKEDIAVATSAQLKAEAQGIEKSVFRAVRLESFEGLTPEEREVCLRLFKNRGWNLPDSLVKANHGHAPCPLDELTLWKGVEICIKSPQVRNTPNRERHEQSFVHIVQYFGREFPLKSLWVPQIREYMEHRLSQGAAGSTVNKEKSALSKMFQVLHEYQYVESNPAKMVKGADERDGEREVYISSGDFTSIVVNLPRWVQPISRYSTSRA